MGSARLRNADAPTRRGILLAELAIVILLLGVVIFTVAHMFHRLARGVRTETEYAVAEDVLAAQIEYLRTRTDDEIASAAGTNWPLPMDVTRYLPGAEVKVEAQREAGPDAARTPWHVRISVRWQVVEAGAREVVGESVILGVER